MGSNLDIGHGTLDLRIILSAANTGIVQCLDLTPRLEFETQAGERDPG
jgi:hypothetical protein